MIGSNNNTTNTIHGLNVTGDPHINIHNNIIANYNLGYVINGLVNQIENSTNNLLFSKGPILYHGADQNYMTLEDLQGDGLEINSIHHNPGLEHTQDFMPISPLAGTGANTDYLADFPNDYDGIQRSTTTPSIGALEFQNADNPVNVSEITVGDDQMFETIGEVITLLTSEGVDLPSEELLVRIRPGEYDEILQFTSPIPGLDSEQRIRFKKDNNFPEGNVIITTNSADTEEFLMLLSGQRNLSFEDLTLRNETSTGNFRAVELLNSHDVAFDNIIFDGEIAQGGNVPSTLSGSLVYMRVPFRTPASSSDISILNSEFTGGNIGIEIEKENQSSDELIHDVVIENNNFDVRQSALYAEQIEGLTFIGNSVSISTDFNPVFIENISGKLEFASNTIIGGFRGVVFTDIDAAEDSWYVNNITVVQSTTLANTGGSSATFRRVSNLFVVNNTFLIRPTETTNSLSASFVLVDSEGLTVKNNIFANYGQGKALTVDTKETLENSSFEFNNYSTNGSAIVMRNAVSEKTDWYFFLEELQQQYDMDLNGYEAAPMFTDFDLPVPGSHIMYQKGSDVIFDYTDLDALGNQRTLGEVNIGAAEYNVTTLEDPLEGVYDIGTGQDFTSLNSAISVAQRRGISGDVTFNVHGNMTTNTIVSQIEGLRDDTQLTIRGNSAFVSDGFKNDPDEFYTIHLTGVKNVTLENLLFSVGDIESGARSHLRIGSRTENITIQNNVFSLERRNTNGDHNHFGSHITANQGIRDKFIRSFEIVNNRFLYGERGLYFDIDRNISRFFYLPETASNETQNTNFRVADNSFFGLKRQGIHMSFLAPAVIENNLLRSSLDVNVNIGISIVPVKPTIIRNNIVDRMESGILVSNDQYSPSYFSDTEILVYNNTVASIDEALVSRPDGVEVVNNQFINYGPNSSFLPSSPTVSFSHSATSNVVYKNNIAVNISGGVVMFANNSDFGEHDHNIYYSPTRDAFNNSTNTSLAFGFNEWVSNQNDDANSFFRSPRIFSVGASNMDFLKNGTNIPFLTEDINGEQRDPILPTIGPYEIVTDVWETSVEEETGAEIALAGSPLQLEADILNDGIIELEFVLSDLSDTDLPEDVEQISPYLWKINSTAGIENGILRTSVRIFEGVESTSDLVWLKREDDESPWINLGNAGENSWLVSGTSFDSFSEFAVGSANALDTFSPEGLANLVITGTQGWRMISSPFENTTFSQVFTPVWTQGIEGANFEDGEPNLFSYNEEAGEFEPINSMYDLMESATGYLSFIFNDDHFGVEGSFPKNIELFGNEPESVTDINLSYTSDTDEQNRGWNLLGNPYNQNFPISALGLDQNPEINNFVYIWDPEQNDYNIIDASEATGEFLEPFQGFFLKTNSPDQDINFTFPLAVSQNHTPELTTLHPSPEINITFSTGERSQSINIGFKEDGALSINPNDAFRLQSFSDVQLQSFLENDGVALARKTLPLNMSSPIQLPLHIKTDGNTKEVAVDISTSGFPEDWDIRFEDKENQTSISLLNREVPFDLLSSVRNEESASSVAIPIPEDESSYQIVIEPGTTLSSDNEQDVPSEFVLHQNYPNPFNPTTIISYDIPTASHIQLQVYDVTGRLVANLVDSDQSPGRYQVQFDASHLSSGVYIYRLRTSDIIQTGKMMLIK